MASHLVKTYCVHVHKAYKMSKMQGNVDMLWHRQNNDQSKRLNCALIWLVLI